LQPAGQPVVISHRDGSGDAVLVEDLVIRDEVHPQNIGRRRFFWLLGFGAQLVYEPLDWRGQWKIDIVDFRRERVAGVPRIVITDSLIDIVVEGSGPTYRMLDLDHVAAALTDGDLATSEAASALMKAHTFVETFLHRGAAFPPSAIAPWFSRDHDYPALPVA
jgi:hypothetical protein